MLTRLLLITLGSFAAYLLAQVYMAWDGTSNTRLCGDQLAANSFPLVLAAAVLQQEDQGFFRHDGIDWKAVQYAARENYKAGRVRFGASTIDMQVASICFLKDLELDRWTEKFREFLMVYLFFEQYSKEEILQSYLTAAPLGEGVFGFENAAEHYFKKSLSELSDEEMWSLVVTLKNREQFNPEATKLNKRLPRMEWLRLQKLKYHRRGVLNLLFPELKELSFIKAAR